MIRVLQCMGTADCGGVSSVILNYLRHINLDKYHFDVVLTAGEPGTDGKQMQELGAEFYRLPLKSVDLQGFRKGLFKLLTEERFDVIHVNGNLTGFVALQVAKRAGVKCRIAHSHAAPDVHGVMPYCKKIVFNALNCLFATKLIGCGKKAGEYAFGKWGMRLKKAIVLPNAIETERFAFDPTIRDEVRRELGFDGRYILGCVARLAPEKNIGFALEFMRLIHQKNPNIALVLAGDGEDREELVNYVNMNNMNDYVVFLGMRTDVTRLYQAFDGCILPSIFEGFPVVAVEAMASGLPLFLSDRITDELKFGSFVQYLPLDAATWSEAILNRARTDETPLRAERIEEIRDAGFDIKQTVHILERIYDGE